MFLLAVLLALETVSFASAPIPATQSLVLYRDCAPEKTPSIPIFTKWKDRSNRKTKTVDVPSSYYTNGIEISVTQGPDGALKSIQFGDRVSIPISGLRPGVRFGAFNSVMHSLETEPGFDPKTGGIIRFGFFKSFRIADIAHDLRKLSIRRTSNESGSSISSLEKKLRGAKWGEKRYRLVRESGRWVLLNLDSDKEIHAIYTLAKIGTMFDVDGNKYPFMKMVSGLTSMVDEFVSGPRISCSNDGSDESLHEPSNEESNEESNDESHVMRSVVEDPDSHQAVRCVMN